MDLDYKLAEMNLRFCVLENEGGLCRVLEYVKHPQNDGRTAFTGTLQKFDDFENRFMHRKIGVGKDKDGNEVEMSLGHWWLNHPKRRQYSNRDSVPRWVIEELQGKLPPAENKT